MPSTFTNKQRDKASGFTLVEMLMVSPVILLVIGGFIALMVSMVGEVLITRDHNILVYDTQDALVRVEEDARSSTKFLQTTGSVLAPQGKGDSTAAFNNTDPALIFNEFATDKNPTDTTRKLIYLKDQPYSCGSPQKSLNTTLRVKVIYYIKANSLWRRTIVPPYSPGDFCDGATPWQQNTCSPGYSPSPRCNTNDSEIMQNIQPVGITVRYYPTPDSTINMGLGGAETAAAIEVTIASGKNTAGKPIAHTATIRATKLNSE